VLFAIRCSGHSIGPALADRLNRRKHFIGIALRF